MLATADINSIGADIRAIRRSRGVTLSDLADRLDRSVGWASQVERGLSVPGMDDLRAIAAALEVPLSLLFGQSAAAPAERGVVVRAASRRAIGDADGLRESLLSPDLTDAFEVVHSTFAPGTARNSPVTRPTCEVATLISGALDVTIAGTRHTVGPGDSFRIRGEPFRWANPYAEPAVAIWVIAPPVY